MPLTLYDALNRQARELVPVRPGHVGIYLCGPTVQSAPHVGHARSAIAFDVLRRWLLASGYAVTFVRNVTDIDDKLIARAAAEGTTVPELAEQNQRLFDEAYAAVGTLPPSVAPRATGHVTEMVAMMRDLITAGHAYVDGGDVWFSVTSFPGYGRLSGQRPDELQSADTGSGKRDPRDFALWKGHREGEPWWETPWGPGRPGWHLECSAMAGKYLGHPFDVHAGGLDLVFPHHENERAQSVCALGNVGEVDGEPIEMANHWLHNGMVNLGGEKMSKSVGNVFGVRDALASGVRPAVLRYALGTSHYRASIEYGDEVLAESAAAYGRIETFLRNARAELGDQPATEAASTDEHWARFAEAMDDDLAVSRAVGAVHDAVTAGNTALADGRREQVGACAAVTRRMLGVLGLDPAQWPDAGGELTSVVDALVSVALDARNDARERKDYAAADAIRDRLTSAGVVVEDTAGGQRWRLAQ